MSVASREIESYVCDYASDISILLCFEPDNIADLITQVLNNIDLVCVAYIAYKVCYLLYLVCNITVRNKQVAITVNVALDLAHKVFGFLESVALHFVESYDRLNGRYLRCRKRDRDNVIAVINLVTFGVVENAYNCVGVIRLSVDDLIFARRKER